MTSMTKGPDNHGFYTNAQLALKLGVDKQRAYIQAGGKVISASHATRDADEFLKWLESKR